MREPDQLTRSLQRGAAFLATAQLADGGFESYSSPTRRPFRQTRTYLTTFAPALMLQALAATDEPTLTPLRDKLAAWILAQRSPNWSFNYWATAAPERATLPYPDDLDDTFCALIALQQHDASLIDATCLGKVVTLLVATESTVGGPYRTWLVGPKAPKAWQDIDLAVNSNIACFLGRVAQPLPNLTAFIENAITAGTLRSPYYPSIYPLAYYLARGYDGVHRESLAKQLLAKQRGGVWQNAQDTALAVTALVQLGYAKSCNAAIERLLGWQKPDGSWPAAVFCIDPSIKGQRHFNGSPSLTTALVLEALSRHRQAQTSQLSKNHKVISQPPALRKAILVEAAAQLRPLTPSLQKNAHHMLTTMKKKDGTDEIVLLPSYFNQSLQKPLADEKLLIHLGVANLFGWMAYTIYDDFLDEESTPKMLPVASLALRRSVASFRLALPEHQHFQNLVADTFDTIDGANAWELAHCRFAVTKQTIRIGQLPTFGQAEQLAERSLGHALTPIGVLAALGYGPKSQLTQCVQQIFKHYLIARQLGDDMHDWEADVRAGQISFVVANILHELQITPAKYQLPKLVSAMQKQFWHHTANTVCQIITDHTTSARQLIQQSNLFTKQNKLTLLLDALDRTASCTLAEQTKARAFLAAYRDDT